MSNAEKAFQEVNVEASTEQKARLESMYRELKGNGRTTIRPLCVTEGRSEREYRVPVPTRGMVKASWEDAFCIQWQAWLAADGEIVKVYMFSEVESHPEWEDTSEWIEQAGICALLNRATVGA